MNKMEHENGNGERKNHRLTPYTPKNLFGEDLTNGDGKRRYNTRYMKFYRAVWNEQRFLRKAMGLKYTDEVKLSDKKLEELLKKVALLSLFGILFYSSSFYTIYFLVHV